MPKILQVFSAAACAIWLLAVGSSDAGELTFELPDNEKMCFHEYISKGVECVLEFQVIEGGNYDVDMILTSPDRRELYSEQKKQYDQYSWTTDVAGDYQFCFSNEFSTITHKIIYFDFQVGNTDPLQKVSQSPITAMTQMETSALTLYQSLKVVIDYQTHHKLREAQGRSFAEDLNERVQYWSIGQTVVILIAGIGQVLILRSFFTDRKSPHTGSART